ncbi:MAG TPA: glycosyltransferase WbuB [Cyanobacteria bacterium UBA11149]|nr:glycosyltransferase WbuB [Cyanobacteria bacterium UBA11367]HBE60125.1 glycosyltransferase WbuB [Cyanobacteria bacterium UBA11366]HBK62702.1 glycosyltransferase WbuB [Cyanobacteria bacterium UBA11166]HBR72556.1 glycosyltransferase WbuB [Cyanobacteria bacterium UBA11159]HBS71653.1 glycosyltransferase WbuB [Cyanobacteria bacterium UBA11153]HBW90167.1 glycosyltransferase WbuB [Cyanobacteria bacterium UBA11149]HCA97738.1 glycosyltransferase WbuB [Cyanobacteria bacterium UBA9226]
MNYLDRKKTFPQVLIVVENLPIPFDRRVWMEATTLQKAGYQVSTISPKGNGFEKDYEEIEGIHIYRHPLPPEESSVKGYLREYAWAVYWQFRLAQRVWREQGFNIIHICNPPDLLFLTAGWFKLFHGVKVIFDHHDLSPEMYIAKYNRKDIFYYGLSWAERLTYATANLAIATNESHKEIAITRGRKKPEKVFVVRSGPDLSRFRIMPPNPKYRQGKTYLVGYVGVMGEPEGIDYLLRIVSYLVREKNRQDIHFMLIGGGPSLEKLKALSQELELTDCVEFTGFKQGEELLERLSSCDLCVEPSPTTAYNENCTMNKILEYMAMGKPIVQFDLREGRRSAQEASLYAKPNDELEFAEKILQLLESPQLREKIGSEGRRRMEEILEWRHQSPKLLAAYEKVRE